MIVKLLTEHHLEFLSLKGDCRGSSESTFVKMSKCWKSHVLAQLFNDVLNFLKSQLYPVFVDHNGIFDHNWASLRQTLSSGFPTK